MKIGIFTEDDIFEFMNDGGFLGRSMYDAIFDKIHALITENEYLKIYLKPEFVVKKIKELQIELEHKVNNNKTLIIQKETAYKIAEDYYKENIKLKSQLEQKEKQLNDIKRVIKECKMLYPHEFDWEEQADNMLNIIERNNNESKK